jgi:hypothetical protein
MAINDGKGEIFFGKFHLGQKDALKLYLALIRVRKSGSDKDHGGVCQVYGKSN